MKITYNKTRFDLVDSLLEDSITKKLTKEDFHKLLHFIENLLAFSFDNNNEFVFFENHKIRQDFGRLIINGKQKWKLDLLLKELENKGILIITPYEKKKTTRKYAYSSYFQWLYAEKEIELTTKEISEDLYEKFLNETEDETDNDVNLQRDLLKSDRFKIDLESSIKFIQGLYSKRKISFNQLVAYERMVFHLKDKKIYAVRGEQGGRIFTTFNGIKKELRDFCTIDEEHLLNYDLHCSQPYFMASYLLQKYPNNEDVIKFYKIVTEGDIYLYFLKRWFNNTRKTSYYAWDFKKKKMIKIPLQNREDAKPEFLKLLFKVNGRKPQFEDILKEDFPEVFKIINESKEELAKTLQRLEAEIFIPVCSELVQEGCLSVHDSLFFKSELSSKVISGIRKKMKERQYKKYKIKDKEGAYLPISGTLLKNP